jgi:hypothetical protein
VGRQPATPVPFDGWLGSTSPNEHALERMGIKPRGGGPHQSKTMMLTELTQLRGAGAGDRVDDAILRDNLLGKPSIPRSDSRALPLASALRGR